MSTGAYRAVLAVLAVAVLAVAGGAVRWYLETSPKESRADDACRVGSHGGLVGLDAATGEVRWTNIVPPGGELETSPNGSNGSNGSNGPRDDAVHLRTVWHPEPVDRTIDAADGAVTRCAAITDIDPATGPGRPDELKPGARVGDLTIVPWGSGLRATDGTGKGVWGTTDMVASSLLGDRLLVQVERFGAADTRAVALIDLRTGEALWDQPGLVVNAEGARELVVVRGAAQRRRFRALDTRTGLEAWRTTIPVPEPGHDPRAWEAGALVLFSLDADGRMAAVDARTGALRWTATVPTPGRSRVYTERGAAHDIDASPDGATVVVAIDASPPDDFD